jgi:hypothetical protein
MQKGGTSWHMQGGVGLQRRFPRQGGDDQGIIGDLNSGMTLPHSPLYCSFHGEAIPLGGEDSAVDIRPVVVVVMVVVMVLGYWLLLAVGTG